MVLIKAQLALAACWLALFDLQSKRSCKALLPISFGKIKIVKQCSISIDRFLGTAIAVVSFRLGLCSGTENGLNKLEVHEKKVERLRMMYANCTVVHGNLEITYLTADDLKDAGISDLHFLNDIVEVTGYVLIAHNSIKNFSLPSLQIIWGDKKFRPTSDQMVSQFGLLVLNNAFSTFDLSNLRAIHDGSVGIQMNHRMCHWKTIDFRQLLGDNYEKRLIIRDSYGECYTDAVCDSSCLHCWGSEKRQCQKIYRNNCAPQCSSGMCYDVESPQFCCHPECAAGCFGPSDSECYGCSTMRDNGKCVDKCPTPELYDPITTQYVKNPDGKYAFNRDCVTTCPAHMVVYKDGCVSRCPENFTADEGDNVCRPCQGACPKTCIIEQHVNSLNIKDFIGCTKVDGVIEIRKDTFIGGALLQPNGTFIPYDPMTPAQLEALSSVRQVTHYVLVQTEKLKSLNFLRNLQKIEGRKLFDSKYALYITHSFSLQQLGTISLTSVLNGEIYIASNFDLCYIHNIPWNKLIASTHSVAKVRKNREADVCEAEGRTCDVSCDLSQGCWGPGSEMCFECLHWRLGNVCVDDCSSDGEYQASPKQCALCHSECISCTGPGSRNCTKCRHVSLDGECIRNCPQETHFENPATHVCEPCHANCYSYGCTGSGNFVGIGGCNRCKYGVFDEDTQSITRCLRELSAERLCSEFPDLENYYWTVPLSTKIQTEVAHAVCMKCHPACKSCYGYGVDFVHYGCDCLNYTYRETPTSSVCVLQCPKNTFIRPAPDAGRADECIPCDSQCDGCVGPTSTDCVECVTYKDYLSDTDRFNCTNVCPADRPYVSADRLCTDINMDEVIYEKNKRMQTIVISAVVAALFLGFVVFLILILFMKRKASLLAHLEEPDPKLEINSDACPNLTRLLLIRESELKRGGILGYGAFGAVYKGVWIPQKEKVKVPVAIKVLHEANAAAQQETLEEARIMASVSHTYLVRLIGVCVGQQMMLVTPLMPLGNLLDYVQENKSKIGSAALIRWSSQIAGGMSYLEEHRLVHRDLAARNVLVKTPYHVRITDFGLAKLLEYGQEEIKIFEGKMPIKWLALECIQYRRYTHKSDVWAFGVTLWELFTFGEKPYKDVPLHDIPRLLENGERLPQPKIATLDMYMILIRCWMVDADARPSFKELRESFLKMAKDPGRFLVVEGDALLRLPTYTPQDQQQMIRQLIDDPDVIDPEDYFSAPTASPLVSPVTPTKPLIDDVEMRLACGPPHRHAGSVSQRYASDPVKSKLLDNSSLSTDQDNYLIPDSQQPQRQSFINEDDGVFVNYSPMPAYNGYKAGNHVYYNDFPPEKSGICLENFEYMQGGNGSAIYTNTCPVDCNADSVQTETVV
ncbi:Epidermal growth factor receptor [Trichinella pseudospiralis]|uniref:Receptor protein-tyrosine kinase n=1 Tax=Trichinella pseudospiralis TaxID=6337 RepID=A0A0V1J583_TRIPS|nr:Epidermal growth factor receptor [Trichinella pseudospiralis]